MACSSCGQERQQLNMNNQEAKVSITLDTLIDLSKKVYEATPELTQREYMMVANMLQSKHDLAAAAESLKKALPDLNQMELQTVMQLAVSKGDAKATMDKINALMPNMEAADKLAVIKTVQTYPQR